ncbi:metal-dependent hydrolase [Alicyclobacillus kakegawensis]|uniref:metal-dependent hydrolase n=1 Tax=Alicyclobacillus kakegawensis TaxID=392012 RepID=UPI00082D4043|nr:metal-dependent hydrolase [Alicyclobacillus kakegawensis]
MLGRTHMAIGAVASVAVAPFIVHAPWDALRNFAQGREWQAASGALVVQALLVVTAVVGSLLPDLDQRNSLAARKVERVGQVVAFVLMAALLFLMHWQTHWALWALAIVVSFALGANSNIARRIGLGITGAGLLFLAVHGAILLTVWILDAMFTEHRTFTHSLLGTALLVAGAFTVLDTLGQVHGCYSQRIMAIS